MRKLLPNLLSENTPKKRRKNISCTNLKFQQNQKQNDQRDKNNTDLVETT